MGINETTTITIPLQLTVRITVKITTMVTTTRTTALTTTVSHNKHPMGQVEGEEVSLVGEEVKGEVEVMVGHLFRTS